VATAWVAHEKLQVEDAEQEQKQDQDTGHADDPEDERNHVGLLSAPESA
jgi:hypothetical protein